MTPEVISYSNNPANETLVNVTQLGLRSVTSFVVRNTGPSTVDVISLVIDWPSQSTELGSNGTYLLYLASASMVMIMMYLFGS